MQCSLSVGDMPVKITWNLNGKPLSDVQGVSIGSFGKKTSVISIDSVEEHHAGNYTCIAQNRAGVSTYTTELTVNGTYLLAYLLKEFRTMV